ncbi:MAG: hypothetical protein JW863_02890 [Chitinispirillaceae bacterium]|nr:hypothetical protein [Chitinispirillaceae bacterium]
MSVRLLLKTIFPAFACLLVSSATAATLVDPDPDVTITPKGYGSFEAGQIVSGYYKPPSQPNQRIAHIWQQRAFGNIGFDVRYRDILTIDIAGEGMMAFSTPQVGNLPTTLKPRQFFYIKSSNAALTLGDPEFLNGVLQAGMFQYKYNPDVRNLGEYMFRSNPYPLLIYSSFDYAMADLAGLRLNLNGFNKLFSNDLLFHSELIAFPTQNWSLSDIAAVNLLGDGISIGAGFSLHHWFNVYQGQYMARAYDNYYYNESFIAADSLMDDHRAVKVMGRIGLSPLQMLQHLRGGDPVPLFNRNDGHIYGEVDILGTKNYPDRYADIKDRMIYTFGFNVPGLFIIDLINIEFEYCANRSSFSDEFFYGNFPNWGEPQMGLDENGIDSLKRSPWCWSVYVKKSFLNEHLSLIAQFAKDHKKLDFYYFDKEYMSFREPMVNKKEWWWVFKTEFKF